MEVKDAIQIIKSALAQVQSTGKEFVHIPSLNTYLDDLEKKASVSSHALELQHQSNLEWYKAQQQSSLEGYKAQQQQQIEMFRSVIATGQTALKTSLLINGGATVALLTFLGHVWSNPQGGNLVSVLSLSLYLFGLGVLLGAVATGFTYLAQSAYNHAYHTTGAVFRILVIVLVVATYFLFLLGLGNTREAFLS